MFKAPSIPITIGTPKGGASEDTERSSFSDQPTLLKAGDNVKFYSISKDEFENIKSRHS
jgi:hypothetical protein